MPDFAERTAKVDAISLELLNEDYQLADSLQHLLAAEGLLTVHGQTLAIMAEQGITADTDTLSALLDRAKVHIALAQLRKDWNHG